MGSGRGVTQTFSNIDLREEPPFHYPALLGYSDRTPGSIVTFDQLPVEVAAEILRWLVTDRDWSRLIKLRLVCRKWHRAMAWVSEDSIANGILSAKGSSRCRNRHLLCSFHYLAPETIQSIRCIDLSGWNGVNDQDLQTLVKAVLTPTANDSRGHRWSPKDIWETCSGRDRSSLSILRPGANRGGHFAVVKDLNLESAKSVTDAGMKHISKLTHLESLNLLGCFLLTDVGIEKIRKLTKLRVLDLSYCTQITDEAIESLSSKLLLLTKLKLSCCPNLTDLALGRLTRCSQLAALILRHCSGITDAGLASVSKLPHLVELDLSYCLNISGLGLKSLGSNQVLDVLLLERCTQLTNNDLKGVMKCSTLRELNLSGCDRITDSGIYALRSLRRLEFLDLTFCDKVTLAGIRTLSPLSELHSLRHNASL
jgi:hypothetical protein